MPRSRRLKQAVADSGGLPEGYSYCRKCQSVKRYDEFYPATNLYLDSNKYMSICKECVSEMFNSIYSAENSIPKTILKLCKFLDVKWDERALESAVRQIENKDWDRSKVFGLYKAKLAIINRVSVDDKASDLNLTYQDNPVINMNLNIPVDDVSQDVIEYWGEGYETKDYAWLEKTLDEWKKTHKSDTRAEETLLREIVFKQFEIEKARKTQQSTGNLIKELQDLMKTASVDPSKTSLANSGKAQETFSSFIKMIEENEPAEVFGEEREAFKDFQGIEKYFEKYITRPLRNFVTGSRDFSVSEEDSDEEDDDLVALNNIIEEEQ